MKDLDMISASLGEEITLNKDKVYPKSRGRPTDPRVFNEEYKEFNMIKAGLQMSKLCILLTEKA
jgi:hypothetical protein